MKKIFPLLILSFLTLLSTGQNNEKKTPLFGVNFSGLIKTDFLFDTRQTVNLRDGSLVFYPEPVKPDAEGNDINARSTFNILAIQTKVTMKITGPDALGAKTSGLIEAEFFGNVNPNINVFRLRHAYIKLNWSKTELLIGQFWHPMYEVTCNPEVISADAGLPFKVYARNPQLRLTKDAGKFKFIFSALSQIDFCSNGPDGPSPRYLRYSVLPELDIQVQYSLRNDEKKTEFQIGAGIDYLQLTPLLSSEVVIRAAYDTVINNIVVHNNAQTQIYQANSKSSAISANLFAKIRLPKITMKAGGLFSGNGYALSLIGGYAVKSVTDANKGFVDYANIRTIAFWTDISTNGEKWQTAIFGGFSRNLGAGTEVKGPYYSRGSNIDYLYRVAPRVLLTVNKIRFAAELEYTAAAYGEVNSKGYVSNSKPVGNLRLLLSAYYFF
jgi:hypothetical protein